MSLANRAPDAAAAAPEYGRHLLAVLVHLRQIRRIRAAINA
jgi:hypothetical protein